MVPLHVVTIYGITMPKSLHPMFPPQYCSLRNTFRYQKEKLA
jgi:hypothetical protein